MTEAPEMAIERDLRALLAAVDRTCLDDAALVRFATGEVAPDERASVARHVEACSDCRADLDAIAAELAALPAASPARARPLTVRVRPPSWRRATWLAAAAVVAALAFTLLTPPPARDDVRFKGGAPALHVAVRRGAQAFRATPGEPLRAGDALGFFYSAAEPIHLALSYASERGEIVRIHPRAGDPVPLLAAAREGAIPAGLVLDAAGEGGCEWIVALFSTTSTPADDALHALLAARRGCHLDPRRAPPGVVARVFRIER
jgi:hypothetical protein